MRKRQRKKNAKKLAHKFAIVINRAVHDIARDFGRLLRSAIKDLLASDVLAICIQNSAKMLDESKVSENSADTRKG